ncbi:hypothetical protein JG687_00018315 [Phytophthora cactorum]|uniref:Uncharacterized protein n=1 Tax=Phytophthora cactorum TaxID=29920 RepID=A0A8T1TQ47_9STRA|nr:hypothetical protein JG687_00018315 [Phytophthora cactorum]
MGVPLIGCASHRLNRAVAAQLCEHADGLDLVQALMLKLRTLSLSAKLRLLWLQTEDDPSTNHPSSNSLGLHVRDASSVPGHRGRSNRRAAAFCGTQSSAARPPRRAEGRRVCVQGTTGIYRR